MFLLREARVDDKLRLLELARQLDSVNLPTDGDELGETLERSSRSFRGRIRDRSRAVYVICAQDADSGKVAGASMIIAKHGTPRSPHYYLEMDTEERYSRTLRKMFRHPYLRLRYSMDGPTEVGGLIVDPQLRRHPEKVGKQLSWVRFLYIGKHRPRFEDRVIAEMLAPMAGEHGNLFWDHYGGKVTGLSFREADRLSTRDKEFIRALFPEAPLYTFLLPEEVRLMLATVNEQSRGALRLVEQAGMRFLNQVDPFDAGPYYGAATADLEPVKALRCRKAVLAGSTEAGGLACLVACEDPAHGFRAVKAQAPIDGEQIALSPELMSLLRIKEGDRVDVVPLP
ncbi:MAG TPA: arginine N-succinyltransferase [Candidatus Binataceae bacterium]|nr:arginine N-succinyltransferase [Candidatus Binataceae bacterium]